MAELIAQADSSEARAAWQEKLRRRQLWECEAEREAERWRRYPNGCPVCGAWVGHYLASEGREACRLIPVGVPLRHVRPGCVEVRRHTIGDAIRAACHA